MSIGSRISSLRKNKSLTQQDLANKLFVTDKTISSWEANRTEPNLEILVTLSEILDCSIGYLVYGEIKKSDIETEIKIKLTEKEFNNLNLFMKENAQFINKSRQIDTYYQPTYRTFIPDNFENGEEVYEWLRIGKRGEKIILNYKYWYDNKYCDEFEVEIDESKNLDKIFTILGLEKLIIVDKT